MRFNFQISKYYSRENDTVQILDRFSFFLRKACKPTSSEATHLFCRQTRIYCLSRKTIADKYIFLTELYIFIFGIALFRTFEESVLKYDFAAPAPLWREIAFQIAAFEKDAEKTWSCHENEVSNSSGKMKVNCNEKTCPYSRIKKWKWNTRRIIALAKDWILSKRR